MKRIKKADWEVDGPHQRACEVPERHRTQFHNLNLLQEEERQSIKINYRKKKCGLLLPHWLVSSFNVINVFTKISK